MSNPSPPSLPPSDTPPITRPIGPQPEIVLEGTAPATSPVAPPPTTAPPSHRWIFARNCVITAVLGALAGYCYHLGQVREAGAWGTAVIALWLRSGRT